MNRPDNILAYDEMDLKLGIKSSLPHVKSTLALAILLPNSEKIEDYQRRVDTLLRLNATKVIGLEGLDSDTEDLALDDLEESRINCGTNILLYGVPGSGKAGQSSMSIAKLIVMLNVSYSIQIILTLILLDKFCQMLTTKVL